MRKYRVLILTDHSRHSDQNSVYSIAKHLAQHERTAQLDIASRANRENDQFFLDQSTDKLWVSQVQDDFCYTDDAQYLRHDLHMQKLQDYEVVLMRIPRPISDQFLNWLVVQHPSAVWINHPHGIIKTSNKAFLLELSDHTPPIQICRSVEDVMAFAKMSSIVLKPLREYGGAGLLKISGNQLDDGKELHSLEKYLPRIESTLQSEGYLAMKYLKNVSQGDKRILVAGGKIMAYSLRLPAEGSWLCNVAQGGTSVATDITSEEISMITQIQERLDQHGILIYGADTLVDDNGKRVLSEINTLSIGGWPQAEAQSGQPIISQLIETIILHADQHHS